MSLSSGQAIQLEHHVTTALLKTIFLPRNMNTSCSHDTVIDTAIYDQSMKSIINYIQKMSKAKYDKQNKITGHSLKMTHLNTKIDSVKFYK